MINRRSQIADEIMEEYNIKKFYKNRRLKRNKKKEGKNANVAILEESDAYIKQEADKKERFEIGDKLVFTGHEYNLAKIYNYADIFKDKELTIENIQRCPCEENKNDKIKFREIDRIL